MKCDNFTATQILREIKFRKFKKFQQFKNVFFGKIRGSEFWFLANLSNFQVPNLPKIQRSESLKLPQMTFLDHLNSPKCDFTQNWSGVKIIKFQQSPALTSHFESFWSIVYCSFWQFSTTNCDFTWNLNSRKILEFSHCVT